MNQANAMNESEWPEGEALQAGLARGDAAASRIGPILGHLLSTRDQSLFSDAIVVRVRGMLFDLAGQVLRVQAEATGQKGREEFANRHSERLAELFFGNPELVAHCHAAALEWQLTERLSDEFGIDPVLSPLVQSLIGHEDALIASAAMGLLAAQARFVQAQKRMAMPLAELRGDLLHETLLCWRAFNADEASDALTRAEGRLRENFDEGAGRLALLDRVVTALGQEANSGLAIEQGGVALFLSILALRSGQPRDIAAVSTNRQQIARLALGLRACGLRPDEVVAQLLRIHPGSSPPSGLDHIGTREAAQILAQSPAGSRG